MKYKFDNWNHKTGSIPVRWESSHYESFQWYRNTDPNGLSTTKKNYDIYGDRFGCYAPIFEEMSKGVFIPPDVDKIFGYVLNFFDLQDSVYAFVKYKPGMILPWHKDNYPTYAKNKKAKVENVVRIMLFLHDPFPGQQLWVEDKYCTGPAGTWFSWQGATKHMAANLAEENRYVIQITGKNKK
tara:strand:+ start:899 stop:1447 length:549 start_codon:yes stop_codon:yes gene_type:complete